MNIWVLSMRSSYHFCCKPHAVDKQLELIYIAMSYKNCYLKYRFHGGIMRGFIFCLLLLIFWVFFPKIGNAGGPPTNGDISRTFEKLLHGNKEGFKSFCVLDIAASAAEPEKSHGNVYSVNVLAYVIARSRISTTVFPSKGVDEAYEVSAKYRITGCGHGKFLIMKIPKPIVEWKKMKKGYGP
jgi:hypothetical protein